MKIGIITNTPYASSLLQFLTANQLKPVVYVGLSRSHIETEKLLAATTHFGIEITKENDKEDVYKWAKKMQPDIIIVLGYSNKINLSKLHKPIKGIYNVHFGKLPEYRGPSPLFWQLKNGEENIGMSIHELTDELDEGNIVWETVIKNEPHYNYTYLNQICGNLTVNGVAFMLHSLTTIGSIANRAQIQANATYYPKPTFKDVWVQWDIMKVEQIVHLAKACNDWNVGALAVLGDNWEVKIIDAELYTGELIDGSIGSIVAINDSFFLVKCLENQLLKIYNLTVNGVLVPPRYAAVFGLSKGMQFKLCI